MNLGYWFEQVKATIAIAAHLAVPIAETPTPTPAPGAPDDLYLPLIVRLTG